MAADVIAAAGETVVAAKTAVAAEKVAWAVALLDEGMAVEKTVVSTAELASETEVMAAEALALSEQVAPAF